MALSPSLSRVAVSFARKVLGGNLSQERFSPRQATFLSRSRKGAATSGSCLQRCEHPARGEPGPRLPRSRGGFGDGLAARAARPRALLETAAVRTSCRKRQLCERDCPSFLPHAARRDASRHPCRDARRVARIVAQRPWGSALLAVRARGLNRLQKLRSNARPSGRRGDEPRRFEGSSHGFSCEASQGLSLSGIPAGPCARGDTSDGGCVQTWQPCRRPNREVHRQAFRSRDWGPSIRGSVHAEPRLDHGRTDIASCEW